MKPGSLLLFIAVAATPAIGGAHERSVSSSEWTIDGTTAQVTFRFSALDAVRLASRSAGQSNGDSPMVETVRLNAGGVDCAASEPARHLPASTGRVVRRWRLRCPSSGALRIRSDFLFDALPGHLHFIRVERDDDDPVETVLSNDERVIELASDRAPPAPFGAFVGAGLKHIAGGLDHLAFLAGLLAVGGSVGGIAMVVSAFTAAHTVTLALAASGWIRVEPTAVEALIALSVAFVGAENLRTTRPHGRFTPLVFAAFAGILALAAAAGFGCVSWLTFAGVAMFVGSAGALADRTSDALRVRAAVAFLFGLLHGLGFASALLEREIARGRLVEALLGFNLGVEIGQLSLVVPACAAVGVVFRRARRPPRLFAEWGSALIVTLGMWWFVRRAYG